MTSPWLDGRRADRFADVLDANDTVARHHRRNGPEAELAGMAELTDSLRSLTLAPEPESEFRDSLRALLMATADREGIGATAGAPTPVKQDALSAKTQVVEQVPRRTGTTGRTRLALLAGATLGAIVLSGVSLASTDSLPGQTLYQVKISAEKAQLAMAGSDLARGELHLKFAEARMNEATRVEPSQVADALHEMDNQTEQGWALLQESAQNDPTVRAAVAAFVDRQLAKLTELGLRLNPDQRPLTAESFAVLDRIKGQLVDLR